VPVKWATAETFRRITDEQLRPIISVLIGIEWPCPASRIPVIMGQLGWVFTSDWVDVHADTRLPFNYAVGSFSRPHGQLRRLGFPASDSVNKSDLVALKAVRDAFPLAVRDVETILGPLSYSGDCGSLSAAWDLESGGRIRLDGSGIGLDACLLARDLADAERFEETHDMSEFYDDEDE